MKLSKIKVIIIAKVPRKNLLNCFFVKWSDSGFSKQSKFIPPSENKNNVSSEFENVSNPIIPTMKTEQAVE